MRISTLGYVGKQGVKNIGKNKMFSMASIATMAACIFLFGLFFSILLNFQHIILMAEEGVGITVFFEKEISDVQMQNIKEQLLSRDDVSDVIYVSADEAWEEFKVEYFENDPELADGFRDNPLVGSDNYEVYMNINDEENNNIFTRGRTLASTQKALVDFSLGLEGVRKVNKSDVVANVLSSVNTLVGYVSAAIILILLGVSIFLISNTVTMGITVRKEEIAIMKYIGAKDFMVRSPFVIEGLLMGLVGAVLPLILLYFLYGKAIEYIMSRFSILNNIIEFLPVMDVYRYLLPIGLALGVGIGFVGSYFTVRKHLKV